MGTQLLLDSSGEYDGAPSSIALLDHTRHRNTMRDRVAPSEWCKSTLVSAWLPSVLVVCEVDAAVLLPAVLVFLKALRPLLAEAEIPETFRRQAQHG
jgi:hypothetical protein